MTDAPVQADDLDPRMLDMDSWINGAHGKQHACTVYQRYDLLADIDRLEAERNTLARIPDADRAAAGDPADELDNRIQQLERQLVDSKLEVRMRSLSDDERDELDRVVRKNYKAELDAIAKDARAEGRTMATRSGMDSETDVDQFIRNVAHQSVTQAFAAESQIYTLATAIVSPSFRDVEQVRRFLKVIGTAQVAVLWQTYQRTFEESDPVNVPFSQPVSDSDETEES